MTTFISNSSFIKYDEKYDNENKYDSEGKLWDPTHKKSIANFHDTDTDWDTFMNEFNTIQIDIIYKNDTNTEDKIESGELDDEFVPKHVLKGDEIDKLDDIDEIDLEIKYDASKEIIEYEKCPNCNIRGKILDNIIYCEKCGLERDWDYNNDVDTFNTNANENHNTSDNSFMSFKITGNKSYCYQRSLLKSCAVYSIYRDNINKKDIERRIYQYKGKQPPHDIINLACELFNNIKQIKNIKNVYRAESKWGVIGACLFYACSIKNLSRTPKQIAAILGIEEKFVSQGDKKLQKLNKMGIINLPINLKPLQDYLNQYFPALGIPDIYKPFIIDIIDRAEKKYIHINNESRTTSKCVGTIYLLCTRIPSLKHITADKIVREHDISKTTFIKYYNLLVANYPTIKKVFKKHKIPMPVSWKKIE